MIAQALFLVLISDAEVQRGWKIVDKTYMTHIFKS